MKRCWIFVTILALYACGSSDRVDEKKTLHILQGPAQGSTYVIKYLHEDGEIIKKTSIDSILAVIDASLSVWVEHSVISKWNRLDSVVVDDAHFLEMFERGRQLSVLTEYTFHPMVAPLVRAWGFGPEGASMKDGFDLDSLKQLVTWEMEVQEQPDANGFLFQKKPGMQIDVNSYAQGYTVDVLAEFLETKGVKSMMVEVGGEIIAKGTNEQGKTWRIGVDKPVSPDSERELQAAIPLRDAAVATSGTYRKFYEKEGRKFSHTIDPQTGAPVEHNLLSVTVMAQNCTDADAFATAFLVMGLDRTKDFLFRHDTLGMEVYLIYDQGDGSLGTYATPGWIASIEEL